MMQNEAIGLIFLIFSLCCLGTWPALLRVCSFEENKGDYSLTWDESGPSFFSTSSRKRKSSLHSRGLRNICHVYMDYATSYFLVSSVPLLFVILLGVSNEAKTAVDMSNDDEFESDPDTTSYRLIAIAMLGGALLSLGNLSLQWATSIYRSSLAVTLAIQGSLTVIVGTFLNYSLESAKTNHPLWLVGGVLVFLLAIILAATAQFSHAQTMQHDRNDFPSNPQSELLPRLPDCTLKTIGSSNTLLTSVSSVAMEPQDDRSDASWSSGEWSMHKCNASTCGTAACNVDGGNTLDNNSCGGGGNSIQNSVTKDSSISSIKEQKQDQKQRRRFRKGFFFAVVGGLAFGFYSPAFNIAVNDPFQWYSVENTGKRAVVDGGLEVAWINVWFSLAFWVSSLIGNLCLLYRDRIRHPELWPHDHRDQPVWSIFWLYLTAESLSDRQLAFMAGLVSAVGNALQFQAGKMVGYAAADLVHAYPLVSTLWDVFLFEEFKHVHLCSRVGALLVAMYMAYIVGIALLAGSSVL